MILATVYSPKNGEIVMSMSAPDKETVLIQDAVKGNEIHWGDMLSGREYYFVKGAPVSRPKMVLYVTPNTEVGVGEQILVRNIPKGCKVTHPAGVTTVDDGFINWSSSTVGTHPFRFQCFPYQEEELDAIVR